VKNHNSKIKQKSEVAGGGDAVTDPINTIEDSLDGKWAVVRWRVSK
jgi:hypothetical protein